MSGANAFDIENIGSPHQLAYEITNYWMDWKSSRRNAEKRWQETTQFVYATSTHETINGQVGGFEEDSEGNQMGWSHSTHHPKITQIYDNLTANYMSALFPHEDFLRFKGFDQTAVTKEVRQVVENYLRTKHTHNHFEDVMYDLLQDWVLYGNCFVRVEYENQKHEPEEDLGDQRYYSGPVLRRISPYDIVFNPLATSFIESPKIIRSIKTMGELVREYEDNPEKGYYGDIIKKMVKLRSSLKNYSEEQVDKGLQLQLDGFGSVSQYLKSGYVEILEFYGDIYDVDNNELLRNHVVTIVDRLWEIRREPVDTWDGKPMIFHCGWRTRRDNLWAMGPLDNLVGLQYRVNHLENSRADAFDQMLLPTRVVVGDVDEADAESGKPGGTYYIPSGEGSVSNLAPDTTVLQADLQIGQVLQLMEEYSGSPREAMGIRTPGEKTAFEVSRLQQAASRIFQSKINYFEKELLERVINAEVELARKYLDHGDVIEIVQPEGFSIFQTITREDLKANGKLVPMGARHYVRQNQMATNLQNLLQFLSADEMLAQHFPSVKLAEVLEDYLEFDRVDLVTPYGRIEEQAELSRRTNAASDTVELEGMMTGDEGNDQEAGPVPDQQAPRR